MRLALKRIRDQSWRGFSLGSSSLLGKGGGESDLLFQFPAHVSIYGVHFLHQPRFSRDVHFEVTS